MVLYLTILLINFIKGILLYTVGHEIPPKSKTFHFLPLREQMSIDFYFANPADFCMHLKYHFKLFIIKSRGLLTVCTVWSVQVHMHGVCCFLFFPAAFMQATHILQVTISHNYSIFSTTQRKKKVIIEGTLRLV